MKCFIIFQKKTYFGSWSYKTKKRTVLKQHNALRTLPVHLKFVSMESTKEFCSAGSAGRTTGVIRLMMVGKTR